MFEFLSETSTAAACSAIDFAVRRIANRSTEGFVSAPVPEESNSISSDADELTLGLRIIEEIEQVEGNPIKSISERRAKVYVNTLSTIVNEKIDAAVGPPPPGQTESQKTERSQEVLAELRQQPISSMGSFLLSDYMSLMGTILLGAYFVILTALILYLSVALWPIASQSGVAGTDGLVRVFWVQVQVSAEMRMLLIAILAGGLGSILYALNSLVNTARNQLLRASWIPWFLFQPFTGMALATIFYFVVRVPLSLNVAIRPSFYFGLLGLMGLVGMFSSRASNKLQEVSVILFRPADSEYHPK